MGICSSNQSVLLKPVDDQAVVFDFLPQTGTERQRTEGFMVVCFSFYRGIVSRLHR